MWYRLGAKAFVRLRPVNNAIAKRPRNCVVPPWYRLSCGRRTHIIVLAFIFISESAILNCFPACFITEYVRSSRCTCCNMSLQEQYAYHIMRTAWRISALIILTRLSTLPHVIYLSSYCQVSVLTSICPSSHRLLMQDPKSP